MHPFHDIQNGIEHSKVVVSDITSVDRETIRLDCQAKCNRQIEKGLIRGTKAEALSGTVV